MKTKLHFTPRVIRIFISSTFRDMMPEREYLMKYIFPELRRKCKKKFVDITEIDLRWGIPEEDSEEGKVIEICLNEIDKSRPYFIGILGDRYGWTPSKEEYQKHARIIENFPWVKEDIENELSITEMEIQYGVLRNADMEGRAFFFFKENEQLKEDPKLTKLKDKLRNQRSFPVNNYSSVEELGTEILSQLWEQIEIDFPDEDIPDAHNKEKLEQLSFIHSHLNYFQDHSNYLTKLNKSLNESNKTILFGEKGIGKSAILSNWIVNNQEEKNLIYYFCGTTTESTNIENLAQFIATEINMISKEERAFPQTIEDPKNFLQVFFRDLEKQPDIYIIIDGIDELQAKEKELRLRWIPEFIPANVHLILSTSKQEQIEILEKQKYQILSIEAIPSHAIAKLSKHYFDYYSKKLSSPLMAKIESYPLANKPLVLFTLLNELRLFGTHEELPAQIKYYTEKETTSLFFQSFLQRLEKDYPKESFHLDLILPLITISNKGLTESEIIEITGISRLNWSLLYNLLDYHLINKNGSLKISNFYLQKAVEEQYLSNKQFYIHIQKKLSEYFFTLFQNKKEEDTLRISEELPDILLKLKDSEKLKEVIGYPPLFIQLFEKKNNDLAHYFSFIKSNFSLTETFQSPLDLFLKSETKDQQKIYASFLIGHSIQSHDSPTTAIPFYYKTLEIFKQTHEKSRYVLEALKELANIYTNLGKIPLAEFILEELLPYQNEEGIAETFDLLSQLYMNTGKLEKAETLTKDSLSYSMDRFGAKSMEVSILYNNLGRIYDRKKDYKKAEKYYLDSLEIINNLYGKTHFSYQMTLSNLGILYMYNKELETALDVFDSVLEIRDTLFGRKHPSTYKTLNDIGVCLKLMGKQKEAMNILTETWEGQKELLGEDHPNTLLTLGNIADLYLSQQDFEKAEQLQRLVYQKHQELYGEINDKTISQGLALAMTLDKQKKYKEAKIRYNSSLEAQVQYYGEDHKIVEYTQNKISLLQKAMQEDQKEELIARMETQLEEANKLFQEEEFEAAEPIFKSVLKDSLDILEGNHPIYFQCLDALSSLSFSLDKYKDAAKYCGEIAEVAKKANGEDSEFYLKYATQKCYSWFKVGMHGDSWPLIGELGEYHDKLLNFEYEYITMMYKEMLRYYNLNLEVRKNLANNPEEANKLKQKTIKSYEKAIEMYQHSSLEDTLEELSKAQEFAEKLNNEFGEPFDHVFFAKAQIYENQKDYNNTIKALLEGIDHITIWKNGFHSSLERYLIKLGDLYLDQEKLEEARKSLAKAERTNQLIPNYPNQQTIDINISLIQLELKQENTQKAIQIIDNTIPIIIQVNGKETELSAELKTLKEQINQ